MGSSRYALTLLFVTSLALPLRAQSVDEAYSADASALKQLEVLDRADNSLRRWLTDNAEAVRLNATHVDAIETLLKGWRDYTSLECRLVGTSTGLNGASKSMFTSMCQERRYGARVLVVDETKACLIRVLQKAEGENLYAETCLEQLTPLKTIADFEG